MIIHVVNSHLTRKGNFGLRSRYICAALENANFAFRCISRGGGAQKEEFIDLTVFGFIARGLNFVRMRVFRKLNHRKYESYIFEKLVLYNLKKLNISDSIIHLWDYSEKIIDYAHRHNARIILEVPNVTQNYVAEILIEKPSLSLSYFEHQMQAEKNALIKADIVLAPSQFVIDNATKLSPNTRYQLVPFGFTEVVPKEYSRISSTPLKLLFVGNVDERKGVPIILEALGLLPNLNVELRLVGRLGGLPSKILKKDARVDYCGFGNPSEHYRWADIFIFPTWCEGSAKVVYEAMSHGLPVITTKAAGSLITHNLDGILIGCGDSKMLMQHLWNLANSRTLIERLGKNAQSTASKRPWSKYTQEIIQLYTELT